MSAAALNASNYWLAGGWTIFHFLWIGALIWPLAAVVKVLVRKSSAAARYSVALILLGLTASIPICLLATAMLRPDLLPSAADSVEPPHLNRGVSASEVALLGTQLNPAVPDVAREDESSEPLPGALRASLVCATYRFLPWLWLVGAPSALIVLACGVAGTGHLRRSARPANVEWVSTCLRLKTLLGVRVRVALALCDHVASPVLVGIMRPIILLPPAILADCSPEQIEMILLHELAHVGRRDNLINLVQRLVEALLFFHPLVWWLSSGVRQEREKCCDQIVVAHTGRPQAYAETLAALAVPGMVFPRAALAMADRHLVGRIRHILNLEEETMSISRSGLLIAAVTLVACGCLAFSFAPAGQPALLAAEEGTASPDVTRPEVNREPVETAEGRDPANGEFADLIQQYEKQMNALRFEEALEIAQQAQSLEPRNKLVNTMLLKAKYGRVEHYKKLRRAAPAATPQQAAGLPYAPEQMRTLADTMHELRVCQALEKRVWFAFRDTPLKKVIQEIAGKCEINVMISATGLAEVGATVDIPVTARANGTRLSTLLDQILAPLKLDYAVKDDVLKIATPRELGLEFVTRSYPVADLLMPPVGKGDAIDISAFGKLIRTIESTVVPDSWEEASGPGSIVPYRTTTSLVIRHSPEVHDQVAGFLAKLREAAHGEAVEQRHEEKGKAAAGRVAEIEERIKKLEADLSAIRESLKQAKQVDK